MRTRDQTAASDKDRTIFSYVSLHCREKKLGYCCIEYVTLSENPTDHTSKFLPRYLNLNFVDGIPSRIDKY